MADLSEPRDPRHRKCIEAAIGLASSGTVNDVSEITSKLHDQFPDALQIFFDDRYSHKLVYIKELIWKQSRLKNR
jgi:hypothetical protein